MAPVAVMVGPPGAGKTVVGEALAGRLDAPFRDTDADIEASTGLTISDIFVDRGEPEFRELERLAVALALDEHDGVLSVGGGAILDPGTRARMAGHRIVFLDVGISAAATRIGFNRDRPLLLGNPRAQWRSLMDARRPLYEEVAWLTVATDALMPDEVAAIIAEKLESDST
jgi:shikimate kinase